MPDISLDFGGDVQFGPGGNIVTVDGIALTNQRLARRFFTNPAIPGPDGKAIAPPDYIFHPDYGGGVRALIDSTYSPQTLKQIQSRLLGQTRLESTVTQAPPPTVTLSDLGGGELLTDVRYTTSQGQPAQVGFTMSP